jgi:DNA polymerase III delta prime subunit
MPDTKSIKSSFETRLLPHSHLPMPESHNNSKATTIYHYQKPIFNDLCAIARACLYVTNPAINLKLRTSFLLIGPSGCGKTFLANAVADEMQVPFFSISVSDWILLGCSNRGGAATWPAIFEFLERSKYEQGAIIFIDELDKCCHDTNWNSFLRAEIFSLCDRRIQKNINDLDGDRVYAARIEAAREFLANKTIILAGAAFQHLWEDRARSSVGFLPPPASADLPELSDLVGTLPRELINRFSSEIFVLPELTAQDYREMLDAMADQVAEIWRPRFLELGHSRVEQAVKHRKGARFLEEVLLAAIVAERRTLTNHVPQQHPGEAISRGLAIEPDAQTF